jgi:hypothetical protein
MLTPRPRCDRIKTPTTSAHFDRSLQRCRDSLSPPLPQTKVHIKSHAGSRSRHRFHQLKSKSIHHVTFKCISNSIPFFLEGRTIRVVHLGRNIIKVKSGTRRRLERHPFPSIIAQRRLRLILSGNVNISSQTFVVTNDSDITISIQGARD